MVLGGTPLIEQGLEQTVLAAVVVHRMQTSEHIVAADSIVHIAIPPVDPAMVPVVLEDLGPPKPCVVLGIRLLGLVLLAFTLLGCALLGCALLGCALLGCALFASTLLDAALVPVLGMAVLLAGPPGERAELSLESSLGKATAHPGGCDVPARGVGTASPVGTAVGSTILGEVVDVARDDLGSDVHLLPVDTLLATSFLS